MNTAMTMMHTIDLGNYVIIHFENKFKEEALHLKKMLNI
jgi:hypothetical protein